MIGYTFRAPRFEPVPASSFSSPSCPDLPTIDPRTRTDLTGTVVGQIAMLQRQFRCQIGGEIFVAEITSTRVTRHSLLRLAGPISPAFAHD